MNAVVLLVLATILGALGHWGLRDADNLARARHSGQTQQRQARVLRRGAVTCYVVAALLAVAAILSLM